MFNSMRIRTKLVVALLIPLIALASLSWVAIGAASQAADDADQRADEAAQRANDIEAQVDMARASIGPKGAISAIQNERNNVGVNLIGMSAAMDADSSSAGLQASYDTTDQGVADFRKTLAKASPAVQKAYAPVLEAMDGLEAIREEERTFTGDRDTVGGIEISVRLFDKYSAIINTIFDVNGQVALGLDDPELRSGARFIDQMSRYSDREAILIKTVLFPVILPGANDQSFFNDRISHRLAVGLVELNRDARHELETKAPPTIRTWLASTSSRRSRPSPGSCSREASRESRSTWPQPSARRPPTPWCPTRTPVTRRSSAWEPTVTSWWPRHGPRATPPGPRATMRPARPNRSPSPPPS